MKIAVAGTGYVGLSIAVLLAQHNKVTAVDIIPEKVEMINSKKSPIQDEYIEKYLAEKNKDINEERARITTNFYKRFTSALIKNKKLNTYTKDDFISVLIEMNLMTNGSYLQAKSLVLDYLTWLEDRGEISTSQIKEFSKISFDDIDLTALYSRHYFKSFNRCNSAIH